jgi:hypothetical protein
MSKITPDPKCPICHGTGTVTDWVDYGSTRVPIETPCECLGSDEEDSTYTQDWDDFTDADPGL